MLDVENGVNMRRAVGAGLAALVLATPVVAGAAPSAERVGSDHAAAVRTCVAYRTIIGHDTFREAFGNIRGCVAMVVPSSD